MNNKEARETIENLCTVDEVSIVETDIEALRMGIKALEETEWIPVTERLPVSEEEVEICAIRKTLYGEKKPIITTAMYEDGTVRDNDSRWNWENIDWAGWDDEEDCGIIPQGWWEYRHYNPDDVYNNLIDDFVVAWRPLPEPYKGDTE